MCRSVRLSTLLPVDSEAATVGAGVRRTRLWAFRGPLTRDWYWWVTIGASVWSAIAFWIGSSQGRSVAWAFVFVYDASSSTASRVLGAVLSALASFLVLLFVGGLARACLRGYQDGRSESADARRSTP